MSATPPSRAGLNLEIRRNFYDQTGKDLTAAAKDKQANGEESGANGASATGAASKAMEELAKEPKKAVYCYSCGIDCTRVRFHYAKASPTATAGSAAAKLKYDLCPNCFLEGRYPSSHAAVEFVKLEDSNYSSVPDRDAPWTDAELLLLLEGLELYDENWNSVSDHVGSRTREECVMKFLQLEIEDKYLEEGTNGNTTYGALNHGRVPFTQADNPVMSVVSFLAGMSEPNVAAAAAGKSVEEMRKTLRNRFENGTPAPTQEKGKEKEGMKSEDSMDVDNAAPSPQADAANQVAISSSDPQSRQSSSISLPTLALASSAARASALASHEEREMTRLVSSAVNLTLQKFELKMQQFSEMEAVLQAERRELERERQALFLERLAFKKRVRDVQEGLRQAAVKGGDEAARLAADIVGQGMGVQGRKVGFLGVERRAEGLMPIGSGEGGKSYEI